MTECKVTSRGMITLPKDVREQLKIKSGDRLVSSLVGNTLIIHKKSLGGNLLRERFQ